MVTNDILVQNLYVYFPGGSHFVKAVDGIDISFHANKFTAILGESGCGKSVLGQAILGILPNYVKMQGQIFYHEKDILPLTPEQRHFSARDFGIIPQNPSEALPFNRKIGKLFDDILQLIDKKDADNSYKKQLLAEFALQDVGRVLQAYPYELSGGMQQRVLCAMAACTEPKWLLADEPTKGLDEQVAQVVYDNLQKLKAMKKSSMVIITHDINLASQICDEVALMYSGQIVEKSDRLFHEPLHPYTQAFLAALPHNGLVPLAGKPPANGETTMGCKFADRCPHCSTNCRKEMPPIYHVNGIEVRCFLYAPSN